MSRHSVALRESDRILEFSNATRNVTLKHEVNGDQHRDIVNQMIGLLWSNKLLADVYKARGKGWLLKVADALSLDSLTLRRAISYVGADKVDALVNRNPAGDAPVVYGKFRASQQVGNTGTALCDTTPCQTGTPCGTSTCGSCYCEVSQRVAPDPAMQPKPR